MSSIPQAVQRQIEAAERAYAAAYPKGPKPVSDATPDRSGSPELTLVSPSMAPPPPPTAPDDPPAALAPSPAAVPAAVSPAAAEPPIDEQTWQQRYRSLQGMYDSQVPTLQRQVKALTRDLEAAQRMLANMSAAPPAAGGAPASSGSRLTKELIDEYGEPFIDVMRAAAHDEVAPLVEDLRNQLAGVSQRTTKQSVAAVEAQLDVEMPQWRQLNSDPLFLAWLDQDDPFAGRPRQQLLDEAGQKFDAARIGRFFTAFLHEHQAVRGLPAAAPQPVQAQGDTPTLDMASLVAPGRPIQPGPGTVVGSGDQVVVTRRMISEFYRGVMKGVYKNNPQEKARIENIIAKALADGNVTP